jgi:hypothetical protein
MTERADYLDFLAKKSAVAPMRGMAEVPALSSWLYPFQRLGRVPVARKAPAGCSSTPALARRSASWNGRPCRGGKQRAGADPDAAGRRLADQAEADRFGYQARVIRESRTKPRRASTSAITTGSTRSTRMRSAPSRWTKARSSRTSPARRRALIGAFQGSSVEARRDRHAGTERSHGDRHARRVL